MAIDRNFIDTTDLSLIRRAVYYYKKHGSQSDKMKTMYYLGRIHFNAQDYTSALLAFIKAKEYSEQTGDDRMKGMICSFLGTTQCKNYNNKDELSYYKEAYNWFNKTNNLSDIDNARYLLAVGYHNNRMFRQSDSIAETISKTSRFYELGIMLQASNAIIASNDSAERALELFDKARQSKVAFGLDNWYQYAYCLLLTGQADASNRVMKQLSQYPTDAKAGWWKYAIAVNQGDLPKAFTYLEDYSHQQDSLVRARLGQTLHKAEADYYFNQAEEAELKLGVTISLMAIITLIAIIIILILVLSYQKKKIRFKTDSNEMLQKYIEAQRLLNLEKQRSESLEEKERIIRDLQVSFAQMYRAQFSRIGELVGTNLEYSLSLDRGQALFNQRVSEILEDLSKSQKNFKIWEDRVNKDLDNIMQKLRCDYLDLTEDDLLLLSYICVGFEPITIATILNANGSTIRSRKMRLKQRIFSKTTANTSLYKAFII